MIARCHNHLAGIHHTRTPCSHIRKLAPDRCMFPNTPRPNSRRVRRSNCCRIIHPPQHPSATPPQAKRADLATFPPTTQWPVVVFQSTVTQQTWFSTLGTICEPREPQPFPSTLALFSL